MSVQIDSSPSGANNGYYFNQFAEELARHSGQYLRLDVSAIGASADSTADCPPVSDLAVGPTDNIDPQQEWKVSAQQAVAEARPVFECAEAAESGGSTVIATEQARGVDEVWAFSDAIFHAEDLRLQPGRLDDPDYVETVTANVAEGDALRGVTVRFFGAGVGNELSNDELTGLKKVAEAVVESQGGQLGTWVTS